MPEVESEGEDCADGTDLNKPCDVCVTARI